MTPTLPPDIFNHPDVARLLIEGRAVPITQVTLCARQDPSAPIRYIIGSSIPRTSITQWFADKSESGFAGAVARICDAIMEDPACREAVEALNKLDDAPPLATILFYLTITESGGIEWDGEVTLEGDDTVLIAFAARFIPALGLAIHEAWKRACTPARAAP